MGWDTKRFIDPESIQDYLMCCICQEVLEEPVQAPCEHTYCKPCITQWLDKGQLICPEDRIELHTESLQPPSRVIQKLLDKLTIRCKNHIDGCKLMCELEHMRHLVEHEERGCLAGSNGARTEVDDDLKKMTINKDKEIAATSSGLGACSLLTGEAMFRMVDIEETIPVGWRLATVADVTEHQQTARFAISGPWSICRLVDGKIAGSGYQYEVQPGNFSGFGDKLLIEDPVDENFATPEEGAKVVKGLAQEYGGSLETDLLTEKIPKPKQQKKQTEKYTMPNDIYRLKQWAYHGGPYPYGRSDGYMG